jgi:predicted nucleotidyltransferase
MRLDPHIREYLKNALKERVPEATVYLFGSRTRDDAKGGDIDLLVLTKQPVDKKIFRAIRVEFYKKFGWQKIDLVPFTDDDPSVFRKLIQSNAVEL